MPFSFRRRPELAGLGLRSRREVRRIAWHFAQRHWTLHVSAFIWIVFVMLHTRFSLMSEWRDYLLITLMLFAVAVINIRLHIERYLKPARAIFDLLGSAAGRFVTGR